jgi:hypothetical protein
MTHREIQLLSNYSTQNRVSVWSIFLKEIFTVLWQDVLFFRQHNILVKYIIFINLRCLIILILMFWRFNPSPFADRVSPFSNRIHAEATKVQPEQ